MLTIIIIMLYKIFYILVSALYFIITNSSPYALAMPNKCS